jgi:hypothetical protein
MKEKISISLKTLLTIQNLLVLSLIPMDIFLGEIRLDLVITPYLFFSILIYSDLNKDKDD